MRRRRWPWLVAAVLLLGAAAYLMSREDPERPPPVWERVEMPRRMRVEERQRAERRRTVVVPTFTADAGTGANAPAPRPRDPVLAAMPSSFERGLVVVEANAIRHSPVGELLLECVLSRDDGRALARFREMTGVDPLADLDRVALADDTLVLSGHFEKAKWKELFPGGGRPFGQDGTLFQPLRPDGGVADGSAGVWRDELFVVGESEDEVRAVIDRLEGRGIHGPPALDESQSFGEIYGVLSPDALANLLPEEHAAIADKLRQSADRIELHVDTTSDVGIVANVSGPNADDSGDLGKTLGAALSLARLQAQAEGQTEVAELMELARVVPGEGDFRMEMGLPLEVLEKHLKACVERNREGR